MRPAPGRARAMTSASTRPMRWAASPSRGSGHTPPRLLNPARWPRSPRRRQPYRPVLPARIAGEGLVSDAQMETVIYAGEALRQPLARFVDPRRSAAPADPGEGMITRSAVSFHKRLLPGRRDGLRQRPRDRPESSPTTWPRAVLARSGCRRTTPCWRTRAATGSPLGALVRTSRRSRRGSRPTPSGSTGVSSIRPTPRCAGRRRGDRALYLAWTRS